MTGKRKNWEGYFAESVAKVLGNGNVEKGKNDKISFLLFILTGVTGLDLMALTKDCKTDECYDSLWSSMGEAGGLRTRITSKLGMVPACYTTAERGDLLTYTCGKGIDHVGICTGTTGLFVINEEMTRVRLSEVGGCWTFNHRVA